MRNKKYTNYYDSLSRREYYENAIFPKSMLFYAEINKLKNTSYSVDSTIGFRGVKFGDSPERIAKVFGTPRYVLDNHGLSSMVFFYKESICNSGVITQIHFFEEEFYSACYTFRHHSHSEMLLIKRTLFEKHVGSQPASIEKYNRLNDKENNSISIIENVNLNILYLWGHEKITDAVYSRINSGDLKRQAKPQKIQLELLMKL